MVHRPENKKIKNRPTQVISTG